jgi:hypothetical protein
MSLNKPKFSHHIQTTRRDFLRLTGLALAGSFIAACDRSPGTELVGEKQSEQGLIPTSPQLTSTVNPEEFNTIEADQWARPIDVLLPDGTPFMTWDPVLEFGKTYYVNGSAANASDENPGTKLEPFKTINRAAEVVQPGERVLVAGGVYRELIQPKRGGLSPDKMISYQAMEGQTVVLSGSRHLTETWVPSEMAPGAWKTIIPESYLTEDMPFSTANLATQPMTVLSDDLTAMSEDLTVFQEPPFVLPRGLVFQNNQRLVQIPPEQVGSARSGNYWITDNGRTLHLLPVDRKNPNTSKFEIAIREQVFAPQEIGLGFIHVKGFIIEHAANGFPLPQLGALSTTRGHHWLIEQNTIRQVNSIGLDIGIQHWSLPQPPFRPGYHIIRNNIIRDCGVSGIQGFASRNNLIEENILIGNAFHPVEVYWETGAIKTHGTTNCLIRRNQISYTYYGPAIWIDFENVNSRISQNLIFNTNTILGAIFVEASTMPNMIDHNFIWETNGCGIYEHDSSSQSFCHNFIGFSSLYAVRLGGKVTNRLVHGQPVTPGNHQIVNNIFYRNLDILFNNGEVQVDTSNNMSKGIRASLQKKNLRLTWQVKLKPPTCQPIPILTKDYFSKPRTNSSQVPGLFLRIAKKKTNVNLNLISK